MNSCSICGYKYAEEVVISIGTIQMCKKCIEKQDLQVCKSCNRHFISDVQSCICQECIDNNWRD